MLQFTVSCCCQAGGGCFQGEQCMFRFEGSAFSLVLVVPPVRSPVAAAANLIVTGASTGGGGGIGDYLNCYRNLEHWMRSDWWVRICSDKSFVPCNTGQSMFGSLPSVELPEPCNARRPQLGLSRVPHCWKAAVSCSFRGSGLGLNSAVTFTESAQGRMTLRRHLAARLGNSVYACFSAVC